MKNKCLSLEEAIRLCADQYKIMIRDRMEYKQNISLHFMKMQALDSMGFSIPQNPQHGCFLCQYVKEKGVNPGFKPIEIKTKPKWYWPFKTKPKKQNIMECALYCPMTGKLWNYRGCALDPKSVYLHAENGQFDALYHMYSEFLYASIILEQEV